MAHLGTTKSWKGATPFSGYEAGTSGANPGVLLIHEWWGLDHGMKEMADELSKLGLRALAIDLYGGQVATDRAGAAKLMQALDKPAALAACNAAVAELASSGAKVGTIGWCMGGGFSLRTSLAHPEKVAATVVYYGEVSDDAAALAKLQGPVLGIFADKDAWITKEMASGFEAALERAKVPHEVKIYAADHAFQNPKNAAYDSKCAADAWKRTTDFFRKHLLR